MNKIFAVFGLGVALQLFMPAETSASELVFRCTKAKSWAAYVGMQLLDDRESTMTPGVMVLNPEQKSATSSGVKTKLVETPERYISYYRSDDGERYIFSIWKKDYTYSWIGITESGDRWLGIDSASGKCRRL